MSAISDDLAQLVRRRFFLFLAMLPGGMLVIPLGFLVLKAGALSTELLGHVGRTLLVESLINTFLLLGGVLAPCLAIGVGCAWLLARFSFPFSRFWRWALLLPLAMPAYVVSFVWISWMDYSGLVPSFLRDSWGMTTPALFSGFRSLGGLLVPLCLSFFPYIYLLVLEGFESQSRAYSEVASSLGLGRGARLWKLQLPLLLPWLASGALLVGMETLADFGSVSVFNVQVFTTLVYRSWFALQSIETASFFAIVHVLLVALFAFGLSRLRGRGRFSDSYAGRNSVPKKPLKTLAALSANLVLTFLWLISFALPALQLMWWTSTDPSGLWDARLVERILNSMWIALAVALIALFLSAMMLLAKRFGRGRSLAAARKISQLGYGIPGTVVAVAWMASLSFVLGSMQTSTWIALGALIAGLSTRFMALALRPLESASERISKSVEESSLSSGVSAGRTLVRIHWPLLRNAFGVGFVFVFIDTLKEMPMTLLMRPYGWDTLAVRVHQYTSDGLWKEAAPASLVIVAASVLPIFLMRRRL